MKKLSVLIAMLMIAALAACGNTEDIKNTAEVSSRDMVTEMPTETTEVKPAAEPVSTNSTKEWVVGTDIQVVENPEINRTVGSFPKVSFILPEKLVDTIVCDNGGLLYYVEMPDTGATIEFSVVLNIWNEDDCCSYPYHKEFIEYGRYMVDIGDIFDYEEDSSIISIVDLEKEITVELRMSIYTNIGEIQVTEDMSEQFKELTEENREHIKSLVSSWDENFVVPNTASTEASSESTESVTYTRVGGEETVEIIGLGTENARLIANDWVNNCTFDCSLVNAGENYYLAIDGEGTELMQITFYPDHIFVNTPFDGLANLYGDFAE